MAKSSTSSTSDSPPGPWMGALARVLWDPLALLEGSARRYGDVVCLFRNRFYLVNHPDHVQRLLHDKQEIYSKNRREPRREGASGHPSGTTEEEVAPPRLPEGRPDPSSMGRRSVALSEDKIWRRRRTLVQPAFRRHQLAALAEGVTAATAAMLARWREGTRHDAVVEVEQELIDLILEILVRSFFGESAAGKTAETVALVNDIHEYFDSRAGLLSLVPESLPTPANRRFKRAFNTFTDFIYEAMEERQGRGEEQPDLLGQLLLARDREGEGLSREEVYDEIFMLSTLGHKTTATALTWTLYLLSQTQDVEARLHQELVRELGERRATPEDLSRLPYLRQVIEESMRLYPPTWLIGRMTLEDDTIGGYRIPAGAYTVFSPYLLHRHPAFWDQPERFDPDRFSPERSADRPRYAYVPFGGGQRVCIAKHFAMMEISLILAEVVRSFRLELKSGHRVQAQPRAVLHPRGGVPMHLRPRS